MLNNFNSSLNLKLIRRCPVCSQDYQQSMIQVLDENEYGVLTYSTCHNCGSNLLTRFTSMPQGVVGNAILTDLLSSEVMDFAKLEELAEDDVIFIQQALSQKDLIKSFKKSI